MTLEETIAQVVRAEVRQAIAEVRQALAGRPAEDRYLSVREAAALAGVHCDTIRNWLKAGQLPQHHAGRELRVRRSELERFMATGGKRSARQSPKEEAEAMLARARR